MTGHGCLADRPAPDLRRPMPLLRTPVLRQAERMTRGEVKTFGAGGAQGMVTETPATFDARVARFPG